MVPSVTMGQAYGDALPAARASDLISRETVWARERTIVRPDTNNRALYAEWFGQFLSLIPATQATCTRSSVQRTAASRGRSR